MTTQQIVGLALVGGIFAWAYLPNLKSMLLTITEQAPALKPESSLMDQIEDVVRIRESQKTTEVTKACNALLEVLLKVKT